MEDFSRSNRETYRVEDSNTSSSGNNRLSSILDSGSNEARSLITELLKTKSSSTVYTTTILTQATFKEKVMQITETLYDKYPLITIDDKVLGEPRLAGTRFAVSNVLTAITLYDSFDELIEEYDNRYTKEQLKDAVRFARDFLDSFYRS